MPNIDQSALADTPVQNQILPKSGPLVVPITCRWDSFSEFRANLQNLQSLGRFGNLQTIYVDNSASTQAVSISVPSGQTITVQAGRQGYYPLLCPNPIDVTFSVAAVAASELTKIHLINVPLAPFEWTGDETNTTPITVEATARQTGNDSDDLPMMIASASLWAAGDADADFSAFLTPTLGNRIYLKRLVLALTPNAAFTSGASWIYVYLSGATDYKRVPMIPGQTVTLESDLLGDTNEVLTIQLTESDGTTADTLSAGLLEVNADYADGLFT